MTDEEFEALLDDCCETQDRTEWDRDAAYDCCRECGVEHDAEHPPHYNVPRCKFGTRSCVNVKHFEQHGAEA